MPTPTHPGALSPRQGTHLVQVLAMGAVAQEAHRAGAAGPGPIGEAAALGSGEARVGQAAVCGEGTEGVRTAARAATKRAEVLSQGRHACVLSDTCFSAVRRSQPGYAGEVCGVTLHSHLKLPSPTTPCEVAETRQWARFSNDRSYVQGSTLHCVSVFT